MIRAPLNSYPNTMDEVVYQFSVSALINYRRFSGLKHHPLVSSQFCRSELQHSSHWPRCVEGCLPYYMFGKKSVFTFTEVVGQVQVFVVVEPRPSFPCWLSAGTALNPWKPVWSPCTRVPLHLWASNSVRSPSAWHLADFLCHISLQPAGESSLLLRTHDWAHPDYPGWSHYFQVTDQ